MNLHMRDYLQLINPNCAPVFTTAAPKMAISSYVDGSGVSTIAQIAYT